MFFTRILEPWLKIQAHTGLSPLGQASIDKPAGTQGQQHTGPSQLDLPHVDCVPPCARGCPHGGRWTDTACPGRALRLERGQTSPGTRGQASRMGTGRAQGAGLSPLQEAEGPKGRGMGGEHLSSTDPRDRGQRGQALLHPSCFPTTHCGSYGAPARPLGNNHRALALPRRGAICSCGCTGWGPASQAGLPAPVTFHCRSEACPGHVPMAGMAQG